MLLLQLPSSDLQVFYSLQLREAKDEQISAPRFSAARSGKVWQSQAIFAWPFPALSSPSTVLCGALLCPLPSLSSVAAVQCLS